MKDFRARTRVAHEQDRLQLLCDQHMHCSTTTYEVKKKQWAQEIVDCKQSVIRMCVPPIDN